MDFKRVFVLMMKQNITRAEILRFLFLLFSQRVHIWVRASYGPPFPIQAFGPIPAIGQPQASQSLMVAEPHFSQKRLCKLWKGF
jgi:hypothetical protein